MNKIYLALLVLGFVGIFECSLTFLQPPISSSTKRNIFSAKTSLKATTLRPKDDDDDADTDKPRPWPPKEQRDKNYSLMKGEIVVRFINAPGRSPSNGKNDIVTAARPGEILIAVGDSAGIQIPRGCMTGLCGSCTCDVEDPSFPGSRGILRACSTQVSLPEGCDEMVVDLYRMVNQKGRAKPDPMARFNKLDDPKEGFKARWNLPDKGSRQKCTACGVDGVDPKGMIPDRCTFGPGCPFSRK